MEGPKKVLYLITKSNFGGAQKYVFELASGAKENGFTVAVATGGTGLPKAPLGLLATKLQAVAIPVYEIKHFLRDMSLKDDVVAFFEIMGIIREFRPDTIHISSSKAGGLGVVAARFCGVKNIIFTVHGLPADETWRSRLQKILISLSTWFTCFLSHKTIVITKEAEERLRNQPALADKILYIKNGIAPQKLKDRTVARNELLPHLPTPAIIIGGIGELHPNKNWSLLIHAAANLPKNVHICVLGEGEERPQLELLASKLQVTERVHLLGFKEDAASYLSAFDLFSLPSKKEGLPYVLLEAGLAALPVVASNLPGMRDIIETGEHGILVDITTNELSAGLQFLLRDEGVRKRLGEKLRERVLSEFSIETMREKTFATYSSIIPSGVDRTVA